MAYNLRGRRSGAAGWTRRASDALATKLAAALALDDAADDNSFSLVQADALVSRRSPPGESSSGGASSGV